MKTSKKQKSGIFNAMRHQLSIQHMDSLEYPNGLIVGDILEKNTQAVFSVIDNLPDFAIHNVIARLRGDFREIRRFALSNFDDPIDAMKWMYDNMMGQTKLLLHSNLKEEHIKQSEIDSLIDEGQEKIIHDELIIDESELIEEGSPYG